MTHKLSRLHQAVKHACSYDSAEVLGPIEESLTFAQYNEYEAFLKWLVTDGPGNFGWNLPEIWQQWKQT